jgi:hypothetical protein
MSTCSACHLTDLELGRAIDTLVAREHSATATLIAHLAEFDARRLYLPAGHPSMFLYCVEKLGFSDDEAFKRIRVARTVRQFPAALEAVAAGRLHLTAVVLLTPYLTAENAEDLLAAAAGRTRGQIEHLLAARFPRPDLPTLLHAVPGPGAQAELAPEPVGARPGRGPDQLVPEPVAAPAARPRVAPLSAERFALQVTISQETRDKLRYAQALLGHAVPSGDLAEVLDRALDALVERLEKRKFGAGSRPRTSLRSSADPRHIPAHVKHAVWERDGGQCSFVSDSGQRCSSNTRVEFDHIDPFARGGEATIDGTRLRCREHNQYEADCVFGAGFMESKRAAARSAAAERKAQAAAKQAEERAQAALEQDPDRSVVPWLRQLGYRLDEARAAAALCADMPDATMEQRIKAALRWKRKDTAA